MKVGVLISGRGSNLQALIDACRDESFPAEIVLVVSNQPGVQGLTRAERAGIPVATIPHRDFDSRAAFEEKVVAALRAAGAELVCCAGFMRILSPTFLRHWPDRVLNIHPSLLPAFPGLHSHEQALAAGVKLHGCSVHVMREAVDAGPIIGQAAVPVQPDDTAETLAARVLGAEHRLYPLCLRLMAEGRVRVEADLTVIDGAAASGPLLINPAP